MNARKSRALRAALGFKPGAPREYSGGRIEQRRTRSGRVVTRHIGTITSTGPRRQYQGAKRSGMASYIIPSWGVR